MTAPVASRPTYSMLGRMLAATEGRFEVVTVTNRDAAGAGSFAAAATGGDSGVTRLVVFAVNGDIDLGNQNELQKNLLYIARSNLWIAGQSCPPAADHNGRGVRILGALRFGGSNVVVQHLRVQPHTGRIPVGGGQDLEGLHWYGQENDTANRRLLFQNCSVHGTSDEAMDIKTNRYRRTTLRQVAVADCLIDGALNYNIARVVHDGADPHTTDYQEGHNYGPMLGANTYHGLFLRNLMTSSVRRVPQFGWATSGLVVNNYMFNFGRHHDGGNSSGVPITIDLKRVHPTPRLRHTECRIGFAGNYAEGGCRSNPWQNEGRLLRDVANAALHHWDGRDNVMLTYYARSGITAGRPGFMIAAKNSELRATVQGLWNPTTPGREGHGVVLAEPPCALPPTLLTAEQAREACLRHAGAWPAERDRLDRQTVDEVLAKTHDAQGAVPSLPAITPVAGVHPDGLPAEPLALQPNGLTAIETWLHARHVAAGGFDDHAAAEWLDRS